MNAIPPLLRLARWPGGMMLAASRYLQRRKSVVRREVQVTDVRAMDAPVTEVADGDEHVQRSNEGVGAFYHRRYRVRIRTSRPASALIAALREDPNCASPVEVAEFEKVRGAAGPMQVGDEYMIHMPGPWGAPVRVAVVDEHSFRFVTLRGHVEAGEIEFRAADEGNGVVSFEIESWARSGHRFFNFFYDRLGWGRRMQAHMWSHVCNRAATLLDGEIVGGVLVQTARADVA